MTGIDEFTPKITEQNLIVRIGKSEVTKSLIIKDCARDGVLSKPKLYRLQARSICECTPCTATYIIRAYVVAQKRLQLTSER